MLRQCQTVWRTKMYADHPCFRKFLRSLNEESSKEGYGYKFQKFMRFAVEQKIVKHNEDFESLLEFDSEKITDIYNNQLIGIDNNSKMFCLACSNMLLRGDGKSNIYHNTCFEIDKTQVTKLKPTAGFLNPP